MEVVETHKELKAKQEGMMKKQDEMAEQRVQMVEQQVQIITLRCTPSFCIFCVITSDTFMFDSVYLIIF